MNDQIFKDEYKNDLSQFRAPKDLIEQTKQVAAMEEKRYQKEKRRKYYYGSFIAAAAVFVICFVTFLGTRPGTMKQEKEYGTTIHLGGHGEGKEIVLGEQVEVEKITILPMEFNAKESWEQEIDGVTVKFAQTKDEYYMAAFEEEEGYILVKAQLKEKESFVEIMQKIIAD